MACSHVYDGKEYFLPRVASKFTPENKGRAQYN
jgi:hypothetical protein